jgi:hypothetical protein
VGDVILRAEQVDYLIVAAVHDRLLKGHEVGPKLAEAVDEHRPALGLRPPPSPQVERGDAHVTHSSLLHHEPPEFITRT